jgi:hypothetical protein
VTYLSDSGYRSNSGDFSFVKDATGYTTGVTGSNGQTYAFDKYPVTYSTPPALYPSYQDPGGDVVTYQAAINKYALLTYEVYHHNGYDGDQLSGGLSNPGSSLKPILSNYWIPYSWQLPTISLFKPVNDFNIQGQVVGAGFPIPTWYSGPLSDSLFFAMSSEYGKLDDHIAAGLGLHLFNALYVDDFGRIIAEGSRDGSIGDYLLTPSNLPAATPTPEPSTLVLLGLGLVAVGIHQRRPSPGRR